MNSRRKAIPQGFRPSGDNRRRAEIPKPSPPGPPGSTLALKQRLQGRMRGGGFDAGNTGDGAQPAPLAVFRFESATGAGAAGGEIEDMNWAAGPLRGDRQGRAFEGVVGDVFVETFAFSFP